MHFVSIKILFVVLFILNINYIYVAGNIHTSGDNNKYFIEFNEKFNWFESQIACSQMNMTLLEIETKEKSQEVNTLIQDVRKKNNVDPTYIWIGGIMNRLPKHHFVWLSKGEQFTYTNWKDGEPNFLNNMEFCVSVHTSQEFSWNDDPCSRNRGYVCEYSKQHKEHENLLKQEQKLEGKLSDLDKLHTNYNQKFIEILSH